MIDRFAEAEAAFKAGRADEGLTLAEAQLAADPKAPAQLYRNLAAMLFRRGQLARAETHARGGLAQHPKDIELHNILGVSLRRQGRGREALAALDAATKLDPRHIASLQNKGNVLNDLKEAAAAIEVFTKLVRQTPANADFQRGLGRAFVNAGDIDKAEMRFSLALKLKPDVVDNWLDMASLLAEAQRGEEALALLNRGVAANPAAMKLKEAYAVMLRRLGRRRDAEAYLAGLLEPHPDDAWVHYQLAATIHDYDRPRANTHYRRALGLEPANIDYRMGLAESLNRSRFGDEAAHIEEAYQVLKAMGDQRPASPLQLKVASEVLLRVCAFEDRDRLGGFAEVGRKWAEAGMHAALLAQMARVQSLDDALELINQHRIWGDQAQTLAARAPIRKPAPRPRDGKIRIGFMSSDLRGHPVAYFALPLFDHYDHERFELYCYSFYQGQEDSLQRHIAERVKAYRWKKDISEREAAQMIADDQLDVLFELGGSTHMNKLGVMAYRAAPLQASWLGYPHSAGPTAIDHIVLDPQLVPEHPGLLIEKPLVMPHTWLALGQVFRDSHVIDDGVPEDKAGFITFGTANNPHKYNERTLRTWARVVREVPNSRFAFIRPEGGVPTFRANVERWFAEEGVSADRIVFHVIRGQHMPFYNQVDITLDPFPLTGGTTTCEALWMGVPVINLRGPALFERLSYSILTNAGLGDLSAPDIDGYVAAAVKLAADRDRRGTLRRELRERMKASPLGKGEQFARDFYAMVEQAVSQRQPAAVG